MTEETAKRIALRYNKRMRHLFKKNEDGQMKFHSTDMKTIMDPEFSEMWEAVEPYLDNCERTWEQFKNFDPNSEDISHPSIGVFSRWGLLKKLYKSIDYLVMKDLKERCKIIYDNQDIVDLDGWSIECTSYDIEFYKGDPAYGDSYPTEAKRKQLIFTISQQIMDILNQ